MKLALCPWQLSDLVGIGTMVFLPTEGDDQSAAALSTLTQAMQAKHIFLLFVKLSVLITRKTVSGYQA
jgi:hypothetical protein